MTNPWVALASLATAVRRAMTARRQTGDPDPTGVRLSKADMPTDPDADVPGTMWRLPVTVDPDLAAGEFRLTPETPMVGMGSPPGVSHAWIAEPRCHHDGGTADCPPMCLVLHGDAFLTEPPAGYREAVLSRLGIVLLPPDGPPRIVRGCLDCRQPIEDSCCRPATAERGWWRYCLTLNRNTQEEPR